MPRHTRPARSHVLPAAILGGLLALQACAPKADAPPAKAEAPGISNNFGFPLGFSVTKLDTSVNRRADFLRYPAGRWLDAAVIPEANVRLGSMELLNDRLKTQLTTILAEASQGAATAPKGSPTQQVGDFFASGLDTARLASLGVKPLEPEFARIAAAGDAQALGPVLAHLMAILYDPVGISFTVGTDPSDRTRYMVYALEGSLPLSRANYLEPGDSAIRAAHLKRISATFEVAGTAPAEAAAIAAKVLEMETRVARKKLTPLEKRDPSKANVRMPLAAVKSLASNLDVDAYLKEFGIAPPEELIVREPAAIRERNAMLAEYPLEDTKSYLRWELLRHSAPYLTPAFQPSQVAFVQALYGKLTPPPREQLVSAALQEKLGHPLSQLYVARHFPAETKRAVEELVGRIRAEFRDRLERNAWLTDATRRLAIEKLDKMTIDVGYPREWIDHSSVEIRRDDFVGNVFRLNTFLTRRENARLGQPVKPDGFAQAGATLPVDINAGYVPSRNGIEIPAAFLQPPFFDPAADAAVNYCTIGSVIGHEFTHGFDSQGRLYDASGNVRNWWTETDGRRFVAETQKLVRQASAFQVLPGLPLNGELTVTENLADVGGMALGHGALQRHLAAHPEENRTIDGFTPSQRCYLAWAQLWAEKSKEGYLRQVTATDAHSPGIYRMAAPSQHDPAFHEAFGITAGDPLWLPEQDRVAIW